MHLQQINRSRIIFKCNREHGASCFYSSLTSSAVNVVLKGKCLSHRLKRGPVFQMLVFPTHPRGGSVMFSFSKSSWMDWATTATASLMWADSFFPLMSWRPISPETAKTIPHLSKDFLLLCLRCNIWLNSIIIHPGCFLNAKRTSSKLLFQKHLRKKKTQIKCMITAASFGHQFCSSVRPVATISGLHHSKMQTSEKIWSKCQTYLCSIPQWEPAPGFFYWFKVSGSSTAS